MFFSSWGKRIALTLCALNAKKACFGNLFFWCTKVEKTEKNKKQKGKWKELKVDSV